VVIGEAKMLAHPSANNMVYNGCKQGERGPFQPDEFVLQPDLVPPH